jgi:hypothetical protein
MNKKWFVTLIGICLSFMMLVGCNADQNPPPEEPNGDQTPVDDNTNNGNNGNNGNNDNDQAPGVDENDTINKDDENDADPDPEDVIEDPKDITDPNNKDE